MPAPSLRREAKKNRSPTATPKAPLITMIQISWWVNTGNSFLCTTRKPIKPMTPMIFFSVLICKLPRIRPDTWKNITPDDQQRAVRIAKISPELRWKSIEILSDKTSYSFIYPSVEEISIYRNWKIKYTRHWDWERDGCWILPWIKSTTTSTNKKPRYWAWF